MCRYEGNKNGTWEVEADEGVWFIKKKLKVEGKERNDNKDENILTECFYWGQWKEKNRKIFISEICLKHTSYV